MKLLIAVLALALAPDEKAPTPAEALAWLKSLDAKPESAQKQPRFPTLTVEELKTMKEIRLGGHRASDGKHVFIDGAGLRHLLALPALEKADLVEVDGLSDESLAFLGKIKGLKELNLGDAAVSSAGLKHLTGLKELVRLDLGWTKDVGDAGMPFVAKLPKLEVLGLGGTKVSDAGLPLLAALPNLKELALMGTPVTDQGLASLAACKGLTTLRLNNKMKTTPAGIDRLKKALPALQVVVK
jgi:Leucine-rich repeat (LRR) protein